MVVICLRRTTPAGASSRCHPAMPQRRCQAAVRTPAPRRRIRAPLIVVAPPEGYTGGGFREQSAEVPMAKDRKTLTDADIVSRRTAPDAAGTVDPATRIRLARPATATRAPVRRLPKRERSRAVTRRATATGLDDRSTRSHQAARAPARERPAGSWSAAFSPIMMRGRVGVARGHASA